MIVSKKIMFFAWLCLPANFFLFGNTITVGGKAGWEKIGVRNAIREGVGKFGYGALELASNAKRADENTDALFDFEENDVCDTVGNYRVEKNSLLKSGKALLGKRAALSRSEGSGFVIRGNKSSIFGSEGPAGSFSISFWLSPSVAENGEVVFDWKTSRITADGILYQSITASFFSQHLTWELTNVFDGFPKESLSLSGISILVPETWSKHELSYDETSGKLEYRVNGKLEAIVYATESGHNRGTAHPFFLGKVSDIVLCKNYVGLFDDFCIQKGAEEPEFFGVHKYAAKGGRFETEPLLLQNPSRIKRISALASVPKETAMRLYMRSGNNVFNWTENFPVWIPVENGKAFESGEARYVQIACELFPDGNGNASPSVSEIEIEFDELPKPIPPYAVFAKAGDGSVTVSWQASVDENVAGYLLYYGERSGEYVGRAALEGASPIDVQDALSITLTGLENNAIYYFAVAAVSKYDENIVGELSEEVFARPQAEETYGQ